jgi:hypothetical protein
MRPAAPVKMTSGMNDLDWTVDRDSRRRFQSALDGCGEHT